MTNVGTNGYVYSSSSYAAGNYNAGYLNFNSSNVNPLNNANRAAALSVRCVQHLQSAAFHAETPRRAMPCGVFCEPERPSYRTMLAMRNVAATVRIA